MKVGINVTIDVTKIDKSKLFKGNKGTWLDLTTFVDTDSKDQYDNNGFISHSVSKEERERGEKGRILGNCKVFYTDPAPNQQQQQQQAQPKQAQTESFDDDIPF